MNLRSMRDQGDLARIAISDLSDELRHELEDAVIKGRGDSVRDRIDAAYEKARPVDFTDVFPDLPNLPRFKDRLDSMSNYELIQAYYVEYAKIANGAVGFMPPNRLVMGKTRFGDVLYAQRQKSLNRTTNLVEYNEDSAEKIERESKSIFAVENDFNDVIDLFAQRTEFMRRVAREVKSKGHEVVYFDAVVEISGLILDMMLNPFVRRIFLARESLVYFMATRRLIDRFIFDAAIEILDEPKPLRGGDAFSRDMSFLIREQACVQPNIAALPATAIANISQFLRRKGYLVQLGSHIYGISNFPKFEGYYDRPEDRIKYGLDIFARYNPDFFMQKDGINVIHAQVNISEWRRYISEFLEAQFLLGKFSLQ